MKWVTLGDWLSRSSGGSNTRNFKPRCNIYLLGMRGFIRQSLAAAVVTGDYSLV